MIRDFPDIDNVELERSKQSENISEEIQYGSETLESPTINNPTINGVVSGGVSATSGINISDLNQTSQNIEEDIEYDSGIPSGVMLPFAGSTAPIGWLLCYGQAISRTTYASLFAIISTTYGSGDGSTTFNVPDMRGRSVIGLDNLGGSAASRVAAATSLGQSAGAESVSHLHSTGDHTLVVDEIPAHTHNVTAFYSGGGSNTFPAGSDIGFVALTSTSVGGGLAHNHGDTGTTSVAVMDPYIALSYIIKY